MFLIHYQILLIPEEIKWEVTTNQSTFSGPMGSALDVWFVGNWEFEIQVSRPGSF